MTHQPDHENTADKAAVTPPPALTTEGRLRARVQTLEEDAERNQGLAKVGARCMREGHQGLIESGRATVEGHRFALSVKLGLGTDATWDAIHERVKELRVDSAAPAAVSAAVAPPTNPTHGLSVPHADALWDAVAIPGPHTPTYPEQHERVCRAVRDILDELTPARDDADAQTALRDRIADKLTAAAYECDGKCGLSERECYDAHPITFSAMAGGTAHVDGSVTAIADAVLAELPSAGCLTPEYTDGPCHCPSCDPAAHRTDRAALLRELATQQEQTAATDVIRRRRSIATARRLFAAELRRMADETATEHRPAVSRWRVETLDNLANEWAPGTGWPVRALAVERFDAMNAKAPRWKDGTPVTRRLVRETTTYTVEAETGPAAGARQDGAET